MICRNCGGEIGDFDTTCQSCGTPVSNTQQSSVGYEYQNNQPIKTTGLLVWSIIEIFCVNTITGIIGAVLWATRLKPAADRGDIDAALKAKRNIKITLWIGIILSALIVPIICLLIAIPNFSGINTRMQVRADKTDAGHIAKATRIWYNEFLTDAGFASDLEVKLDAKQLENKFTRIDEIKYLDQYVDTYKEPTSYSDDRGRTLEGAYYVTVINEDTINNKIVVAIGPKDLNSASRNDSNFNDVFYGDLDGINEATYYGEGSGIAYVEP